MLNLQLKRSKHLCIIFLICYSSACGSFFHMMHTDSLGLMFVAVLFVVSCIYHLFESIKVHALRTSALAICELSCNGGWTVRYNSGQRCSVSIKRDRSICFGKVVLLYMESPHHKKIALLLVGEALSEDDWRRLHKYLKTRSGLG